MANKKQIKKGEIMRNLKVWRDENGDLQEQVIFEGTYKACAEAGEQYIIDHPEEKILVNFCIWAKPHDGTI